MFAALVHRVRHSTKEVDIPVGGTAQNRENGEKTKGFPHQRRRESTPRVVAAAKSPSYLLTLLAASVRFA